MTAARFAAAALAATLALGATQNARAADGPTVTTGLVLLGTIMPKVTLLPVTDGSGTPENFPPGPDVVTGLDASGNVVFRKTFRDQLYNFYVFVPLERAQIERLHRLELRVAGRSLERVASPHGAPEARAQSVGYERVRIRWDANAFPRLSCADEAGGSPAPLMLGGDFTGVDIRGETLRCDFSDGVKTVYSDVRIPIEGSGTKN